MQKITLRLATETDATWLYEMMQEKNWQKYFPKRILPKDLNSMKRKLYNATANNKKKLEYYFAINLEKTPVGFVDIYTINWNDKKSSIGYGISCKYHGKGIAPKAVSLALKKMKKLGLHACEAFIHPKNIPSKKVLEKTGFKFIGRLKEYYFEDKKFTDRDLYWKVIK